MFVPGLSEAEAVRLLDIILFGHTSAHATCTTRAPRRPKRARASRPSTACPDTRYTAGNDDFFRSIVLRKRPVHVTPPQVTPTIARRRPVTTTSPRVPSFPNGLCYLIGVKPADCGAAMLQLGSYPTVHALLNSWLFNPSSVHLVPQRVGLFHAVSSPTESSIPVTLCNGDWNVGADEDFPRLPRHARYDMGPPPIHPRGPPPRYYDSAPRGPRPSDNSNRPPTVTPKTDS